MPYKDKNKQKENWREYYRNHHDQLLKKAKEYRTTHLKEITEYQRKYRQTHQAQHQEYCRQYMLKLRMSVLQHYCNGDLKCNYCGESRIECLQLDHINNDGYIQRKKMGHRATFYLWLIENNYPPGYQILCANCNWYKRYHPEWEGKAELQAVLKEES